jgi:hypothetical protein
MILGVVCFALTENDWMKNAKISIMFLLFLCSVLVVNASSSFNIGVKSGDWMKYDYQETFGMGGEHWQTIEFLNIVGTNVTIRVTIHMSTGIEMNQTRTIDLSSEDNFLDTIFFGVRAYIIPSNLEIGASVYLGEFGNQTIAGETTGNVAGVDRMLVYANFSQTGSLCTFYWDKQTGVLVQGTMSAASLTKTVLTLETNMWSGEFVWWPWVIVVIIIVGSIIVSRRQIMQKLRGKPNAPSHQ